MSRRLPAWLEQARYWRLETGSSKGSYSSRRGLVGFVGPFAVEPFMKDFRN